MIITAGNKVLFKQKMQRTILAKSLGEKKRKMVRSASENLK